MSKKRNKKNKGNFSIVNEIFKTEQKAKETEPVIEVENTGIPGYPEFEKILKLTQPELIIQSFSFSYLS